MAGVELDYVLPSPDLQPFVTTFYRLRSDAPVFDELERAQIAQLRFVLSPGPGEYLFCDGSRQHMPAFHLLGPTTGPTRARGPGPAFVFGVGITPAGWAALLGSNASAMVNRVADATTLFGDDIADAAIGLRADGGAAAMATALEPLLRRLLTREPRVTSGATLAFVRAVDDWLTGSPSPELDVLVAATGLSRRQVERRCNALYGAPPKLLARRYRALRAAVQLASGGDAGDHGPDGFYDQSHLIREVKQFTGLTPRRLRNDPGALTRLTMTHRRALAGRAPRMVVET